jgi:hypothetical protein
MDLNSAPDIFNSSLEKIMKSKARRKKLSTNHSGIENDWPPCFASWLASKLRLRKVFSDKEAAVAQATTKNIDGNVINGPEFIPG